MAALVEAPPAAGDAPVAQPNLEVVTMAGDELEERLLIKVHLDGTLTHELDLSLIHEETELEPIFSGAGWAGTVFWPAAVVLVEHELLPAAGALGGQAVLELGCGLGVPGMVAALLGAKEAVLSEQEQLIPLLQRNVAANFAERPGAGRVLVEELSWGTQEALDFQATRAGAGEGEGASQFGMILCCDCVFEPLYGDSWRLLCDALAVLAPDANTRVLVSLERRSQDGVEKFLARLAQDFVVKERWSNFRPDQLEELLRKSHVGSEARPLLIYEAIRRAPAGG